MIIQQLINRSVDERIVVKDLIENTRQIENGVQIENGTQTENGIQIENHTQNRENTHSQTQDEQSHTQATNPKVTTNIEGTVGIEESKEQNASDEQSRNSKSLSQLRVNTTSNYVSDSTEVSDSISDISRVSDISILDENEDTEQLKRQSSNCVDEAGVGIWQKTAVSDKKFVVNFLFAPRKYAVNPDIFAQHRFNSNGREGWITSLRYRLHDKEFIDDIFRTKMWDSGRETTEGDLKEVEDIFKQIEQWEAGRLNKKDIGFEKDTVLEKDVVCGDDAGAETNAMCEVECEVDTIESKCEVDTIESKGSDTIQSKEESCSEERKDDIEIDYSHKILSQKNHFTERQT